MSDKTEMSAESYIVRHWQRRRVWRHLGHRRHRRRLSRCAKTMEGKTFVDVGCALGHSTMMMAKMRFGSWSGIDFSESAIAGAVKQFGNVMVGRHPPRFIYCPSIYLLREIPPFEGVVCSEVIEHVEDEDLLIESLKLITRKVLLVTTPCGKVGDPGHLRVYTQDALVDLFGPGANVQRDGHFWYVTWHPEEVSK